MSEMEQLTFYWSFQSLLSQRGVSAGENESNKSVLILNGTEFYSIDGDGRLHDEENRLYYMRFSSKEKGAKLLDKLEELCQPEEIET